jgi:endoglucanase
MTHTKKQRHPAPITPRKHRKRSVLIGLAIALLIVGAGYAWWHRDKVTLPGMDGSTKLTTADRVHPNPLRGRVFYRDNTREVSNLAKRHPELQKISSQPGTTWLIGPNQSDPTANADIDKVVRTSKEAAAQKTVPVYQLYAITDRDACAAYSEGGFKTAAEYLGWIDRIVASLTTEAVFSVEADAVAHTLQAGCMSPPEVSDRLLLLSQAIEKLKASPYTLGVYLDAGHSEWFSDPTVLVGSLRKAGIDKADGVVVNVSNFIDTPSITTWAQKLVAALGGDLDMQNIAVDDDAQVKPKRYGVLIDTSRSGKGAPPANVKGEARWCNPVGRGIGQRPNTRVDDPAIDAYFWGKNIGESDGSCFGAPPAGTFDLQKARELINNAE